MQVPGFRSALATVFALVCGSLVAQNNCYVYTTNQNCNVYRLSYWLNHPQFWPCSAFTCNPPDPCYMNLEEHWYDQSPSWQHRYPNVRRADAGEAGEELIDAPFWHECGLEYPCYCLPSTIGQGCVPDYELPNPLGFMVYRLEGPCDG